MANKDIRSQINIESILDKYDISPSKDLGQNFLIDEDALNKIISASDLKKDDFVIEIGPGTGILTEKLANYAGKIVAIEKDAKMAAILKDKLKKFNNITIIEEDILKTNISKITGQIIKWKVVANIPYYLTSPLIRLLLEQNNKPELMTLLVQKEVGERIAAKNKNASVISIFVQFYGEVEIIDVVPKESFWPMPKVDSVIIKISDIRNPDNFDPKNVKNFFRLVKIAFSSRRKTLANNLSAGLKVPKNEIINILESEKFQTSVRAQELIVGDWKKLLFNKKISAFLNN